jgi:hypothetical protein
LMSALASIFASISWLVFISSRFIFEPADMSSFVPSPLYGGITIQWLQLIQLSHFCHQLSRDRVNIDKVWICNWIYWTLTDHNYK